MRNQLVALVPVVGLLAAACGGSDTPAPAAPELPAEPAATVPEVAPAQPAPEPPPAPTPPKAPEPAFTLKDVGLATPESVIYDDQADVYLVANMNGTPTAVDGNGFISRISPDGQVAALKWIDGSKKATRLNSPKGMALSGELLYVADVDTVRMFERRTGKAKGEVKLKGATFAGDVAVGADGKIYVTDIGLEFSADKPPEPTKSDAVWVIEKKKAKALAKTEELGHPNSIVSTASGLWLNALGTAELYQLDDKGARQSVQKLPQGGLDGLVVAGDKVYVSSWDASGVFVGTPGGEFELVYKDLITPAEIGWDSRRNRLLVPLSKENGLVAFDVE
jgi:hypothetical protein